MMYFGNRNDSFMHFCDSTQTLLKMFAFHSHFSMNKLNCSQITDSSFLSSSNVYHSFLANSL